MRSNFSYLILCVLVLLSACQSSDKPNEDPNTADESDNELVKESGESIADFTKRAWKTVCPTVKGETEITINGTTYLTSFCGTEGNYQYLLLQADKDTKNAYQRLSSEKHISDPVEQYYGFPNFSGPKFSAKDINQDGKQELLVEIEVTGKSSGAGADEESFWDESFFEVYELNEQELVFSKEMSTTYSKMMNQRVELSDADGISAKLAEMAGNYINATMMSGELYWGACDVFRLDVGKHNGKETTGMWMDQGMDGFPLIVTRIKGNEATKTYTITYHTPDAPAADNEDGFESSTMTYQVIDDVHYFQLNDAEFYVLEGDKILESPDDCESEEEGE